MRGCTEKRKREELSHENIEMSEGRLVALDRCCVEQRRGTLQTSKPSDIAAKQGRMTSHTRRGSKRLQLARTASGKKLWWQSDATYAPVIAHVHAALGVHQRHRTGKAEGGAERRAVCEHFAVFAVRITRQTLQRLQIGRQNIHTARPVATEQKRTARSAAEPSNVHFARKLDRSQFGCGHQSHTAVRNRGGEQEWERRGGQERRLHSSAQYVATTCHNSGRSQPVLSTAAGCKQSCITCAVATQVHRARQRSHERSWHKLGLESPEAIIFRHKHG
jgi:hypothetical protein